MAKKRLSSLKIPEIIVNISCIIHMYHTMNNVSKYFSVCFINISLKMPSINVILIEYTHLQFN